MAATVCCTSASAEKSYGSFAAWNKSHWLAAEAQARMHACQWYLAQQKRMGQKQLLELIQADVEKRIQCWSPAVQTALADVALQSAQKLKEECQMAAERGELSETEIQQHAASKSPDESNGMRQRFIRSTFAALLVET